MKLLNSLFVIALAAASVAIAAKNPMVGGNEMFPSKTSCRTR